MNRKRIGETIAQRYRPITLHRHPSLPSSSQTAYELLRATRRPRRHGRRAIADAPSRHAEEVNAELLSFFGEKASKATKAVA